MKNYVYFLSAIFFFSFFLISCDKDDNDNNGNNGNGNNNNTDLNCGQTITDTRDNKQYPTVKIGNQCWFKKNLNVGTKIDAANNQADNGLIEKHCYDGLEANCNTFGGLYQWDELMQYSTTPGVRGICPEGWHVPTDAEWTTLESNFPASSAGTALKQGGTSGFDALMAGRRDLNGSTWQINMGAYFWSSSLDGANPWYRFIEASGTEVFRGSTQKMFGFSVRCVKDA